MTERHLTVSHTYQRRPRRYGFDKEVRVPFLRMNGKWLEKAGFSVGSKVRVEVEEGRLVLTSRETPPAAAAAEATS